MYEYLVIFGFLLCIVSSFKMAVVEYIEYRGITASIAWLVVSMLLTISFVFDIIYFYHSGISAADKAALLLLSGKLVFGAIFIMIMIISFYIQRAFFRRKGEDRSSSSNGDIPTISSKV
jgi:Zn-dependent protease with chaperone function